MRLVFARLQLLLFHIHIPLVLLVFFFGSSSNYHNIPLSLYWLPIICLPMKWSSPDRTRSLDHLDSITRKVSKKNWWGHNWSYLRTSLLRQYRCLFYRNFLDIIDPNIFMCIPLIISVYSWSPLIHHFNKHDLLWAPIIAFPILTRHLLYLGLGFYGFEWFFISYFPCLPSILVIELLRLCLGQVGCLFFQTLLPRILFLRSSATSCARSGFANSQYSAGLQNYWESIFYARAVFPTL